MTFTPRLSRRITLTSSRRSNTPSFTLDNGPLLALLLLGAGVRHAAAAGADARAATSFRYRAAAPLFCNEEFHLAGGGLQAPDPAVEARPGAALMKLWAAHPERGLATEAELDVRAT